MNETYLKNVVEAALLAAGRPLQLTELVQLFDESARPELPVLRAALDSLEVDYGTRGIELKETATGFRIQVKRDFANEVSRLWPERPPRYSRALLETLALIAYRQPITRGEIEAVRGVAVNPNIIKTVLERNWVTVVGTRDVPGRPELLGTTKEFLDYFGLRSLEELPPLAELKAMGDVNLQLDLAKPADGAGEGLDGAAVGVAAVAALAGVAAADGVAGAEGAAVAEGAGDAGATGAAGAAADALMGAADGAESAPADAPEGDALAAPADAISAEAIELEHDATAEAVGHVEMESDSGDVTVEVETLRLVEASIEASIESDAPEPATDTAPAVNVDAAIETGEFEMAELGVEANAPAPVIEAEFDADDLDSATADADADDEATDDDEEELSASSPSASKFVAAPRDNDD
jgi:segregation and condensation protein B